MCKGYSNWFCPSLWPNKIWENESLIFVRSNIYTLISNSHSCQCFNCKFRICKQNCTWEDLNFSVSLRLPSRWRTLHTYCCIRTSMIQKAAYALDLAILSTVVESVNIGTETKVRVGYCVYENITVDVINCPFDNVTFCFSVLLILFLYRKEMSYLAICLTWWWGEMRKSFLKDTL